MTARYDCRAPGCDWFLNLVATTSSTDSVAEIPTWQPPARGFASGSYGAVLTDEQVIAAHMATHTDAEQAGRMPSREQLEMAAAPTTPQPEERVP